MDQKQLELRSILHKLAGSAHHKRKREDPNNPLVAYCNALILPHIHAGTAPELPFDEVQTNVFNVEGNPPHKMLELFPDRFEFISDV